LFTKIVASRPAVSGSYQLLFGGWGFAPNSTGGTYNAPPDSLTVFSGPISNGRKAGKGEERREEKEGDRMAPVQMMPPR